MSVQQKINEMNWLTTFIFVRINCVDFFMSLCERYKKNCLKEFTFQINDKMAGGT